MGTKGKEGQSSQIQMNDYEKKRLLRIKENQGKLQQFGVKNIAKSLTSLVDNQSSKKRKMRPVVTNERDEEDIPEFSADNEDNYNEEISKSVKVHKKVHSTHFIAPMSMNKHANLARRRVIAHNAPHVSQSEEDTLHLAGTNVTKRSSIQPFELDPLRNKIDQFRNRKPLGKNVTQKNQSQAKMSMRELLLSKKGSQKQLAVPKFNVANSSPGTSTSSGARRKLFLGANDNEEDDVSFQDMNEADGDKDYEDDENEDINNAYEDDENEDIDNAILRNGIEGNDGISQEIEFISDEDDNRQDGLEDNLGTEDDEPAQVQVIAYRSTKETVLSKTKNRGPTMLHQIHTRSFNEREDIICNEFGQPIGPVINGKDIAGEFSRFLGTVARNYSYAPLIHASWHKVPHKEKIWEYVLKKYNVPKEAKDWVLQTIGASWRVNKCRIKSRHFYKYKDNSSRWKNRPKYVPEQDFQTMLRLWNNKETMKRCSLARDRRNSQKNNHTAGPKSFARIREELKNEDPNKEPPTLSKMFDYTRRRKEGNSYVDSFDDTASKIEKMKNYKPCEEEPSDEVNPFLAVMGKEYSGHRRIYGKGVTNTLIKRVSGGEICNIAPSKPIDVEAEKRLILDMRRELNEEHERKKRELEEDHQRKKAELEAIRKDIDNQRDNSIEDAVKKILQKLPFGIVQDFLT